MRLPGKKKTRPKGLLLNAAIRRNQHGTVRDLVGRGYELNRVQDLLAHGTSMQVACRSEAADLAMLNLLLSLGADPKLGEDPPLLIAARCGRLDKLDWLLANGVDPKTVTQPGYTALHAATLTFAEESGAVIDRLLELGCDPRVVSSYSETPLGNALSMGRVKVAKKLLLHRGPPAGVGWTDLMTAVLEGTVEDVARLASDHGRKSFTRGCWKALNLAVAVDDRAKLDTLVAAGASPLYRDKVHGTLLHDAGRFGAVACIDWLLAKGATVDATTDFGDTALFEAVSSCCPIGVRKLLDVGADPNHANSVSEGPIHQVGDVQCARLLVEAGADLNWVGGQGWAPIGFAAEDGRDDLVRAYIDWGAKVDATSTGATALHAAVRADSDACVRLLLDAGADPNAEDVDGDTALFRVQSYEVATALIDAGADPEHQGDIGLARDWIARYDAELAAMF